MILERMRKVAADHPADIALRMKTERGLRETTFRDVMQEIASVAAALAASGTAKGDRVAILSENRPEWIVAYLAITALGAVVVPLDAQLTSKEVSLLLGNADAKAIFVSNQTRAKLPPDGSFRVLSFDGTGAGTLKDMIAAHPGADLPPAPAAADLAALLYTSGTTGDPKAVMLTQGNLAANRESLIALNLITYGDNLLCLLPLHHTYPAIACVHYALSVGAAVTILNSLKGPDIIACMQETGVSVLLGVPQLYAGLRRAIFDQIRAKPLAVRGLVRILLGLNGLLRRTLRINIGKALFGSVHAKFGPRFRIAASGGARLDPEVYTDMSNLGFMMIEGYGLTETSPVCTFNPLGRQKAGSIGVPLPGVEVRIANPDAKGFGELTVRGGNVMAGYFRKPQETAEVLRDGWFSTGDLGYRDQDGYFFITGRSKEVIVLPSGKNLFPEELEAFYRQIPAIKEICLVPGERGIEAAVVPDFEYLRGKGIANSRETIAGAIEDLAQQVAPYKRIMGLKIFKEPLPVTRLGKLRRAKVLELYARGEDLGAEAKPDAAEELRRDPIGKKLLACIEPFSAKKRITPDDNLELDLGLDSLARVELVVSIEHSFGLSLPESFGAGILTVRDAIDRVRDLLAAGPVGQVQNVKMSWAEILSQEPAPELAASLALEAGLLRNCSRRALQGALRFLFASYGRLSMEGIENLPDHGPYLIAPNHLSFVDAPVVIARIPWPIASQTFFLGSSDYFGGPIMSRVARLIHVIPVDMDTRLHGAMQLSAHVLHAGKILCVFPEGSRSRDGELKEFKKGVGIIARELNVPIVPVAIRGTYAMLPPGRRWPRPAKLVVSFGKPMLPAGREPEEIVSDLRDAVASKLEP